MEPGVSREANEEAGAVERTKPSLMSPLESILPLTCTSATIGNFQSTMFPRNICNPGSDCGDFRT